MTVEEGKKMKDPNDALQSCIAVAVYQRPVFVKFLVFTCHFLKLLFAFYYELNVFQNTGQGLAHSRSLFTVNNKHSFNELWNQRKISLQMKKVRLGEVESPGPGHIIGA